MDRKLKFHEQFQIEIVFRWTLFPTHEMTWKSWAFDLDFGLTKIGQPITSRRQLPESYYYGVVQMSIEETDEKMKYKSLVFWTHCAMRILGFDVGAGFFFRKQKAPIPILSQSASGETP